MKIKFTDAEIEDMLKPLYRKWRFWVIQFGSVLAGFMIAKLIFYLLWGR